jgi:hypothetical protein
MKSKEIREFRKTYTKYEKECVFDGYKLAVLFDEKDEVKRYGGRWNQEEQIWWMPASRLLDEVSDNGTLVRDWLNDGQMIIGQYGEFKPSEHTTHLFSSDNDHYTEYGLHKSNNDPQYKVQFFYEHDVAKFIPTGMGDLDTEYYTREDGKKRWKVLIGIGYNRVENS